MVELFGGKKEAKGIPTDRILQMQQQGYDNDQIVSVLQREGYKSDEIFEAISHADVKKGVTGAPVSNVTEPEAPMELKPKAVGKPPAMGGIAPPPFAAKPEMNVEKIEEIAEAIIEEKWAEVTENINKVIDWKERTESKLNELDTKFGQAKTAVQGVKDELMDKLQEYDKQITDISTEVKAMSRVFEKLLPQFMESVSELSRVASGTSAGKKIKETAAEIETELTQKPKPRRAAVAKKTKKPKQKSRSEEIFGLSEEGEETEEPEEEKPKKKKKSIEDIEL
ncbi:hypothetical protein KY336_01950 [Candidatus Woesearchaeota archaeon]|nr:hypothetical protein [Candidatus Woesearchaeota archaeon]